MIYTGDDASEVYLALWAALGFAAAAVQKGGDSLSAACRLSVFEATSVVDEKLFGFSW